MSSGPSPVPVLVAALVVLIGGIGAAVVLRDDGSSTVAPPVLSSSLPPSTAAGTTRTSRPPSSTSTTTSTSFVATTVRPAVGSPEAAANGLWAAYTASNRTAARRFATDDVVRVLFQEPFNGETGTFVGCRRADARFDCRYTQPSADYAMTVQADDSGSFRVVELTVSA